MDNSTSSLKDQPAELDRSVNQIAPETLSQAKHHNFDYQATLTRAYAGDKEAITQLLIFSQYTDAAGGLFHQMQIVKLGQAIGRDSILRRIETLPEMARHRNQWYIDNPKWVGP